MKLLIADDSAPMRAVIRSMVDELGCEVHDCSNGSEAIDEYRRWRPDWVVMDVRMPGIDGLAATRLIRREFPDARIIVVSMHDDPALRQAAMTAGARCFLHKSRLAELSAVMASST